MRAILLAGGMGTRLLPYTVTLPKPLMPLGGEMPIIEVLIRQLKRDGFDHLTIAVNHMANLIIAFCGDGKKWDIKIDYSIEEQPLSTIGPLTLIEDLPENFLVMNGDVLTDLNFSDFLKKHQAADNDLTVCAFRRVVKVDFGVLELEGDTSINGFREKPIEHFDVSMGVYGLSRRVVQSLKRNEPYGFDNLMEDGIRDGKKFAAQLHEGYWLDIGRPEDYDTANKDFGTLKKLW